MKLDWIKTRQTKYGSYTAVYVLVFIGILVALNYLANRYNETYDATENKLYSLSDQTQKVLDNLEQDLTIYYFDQRPQFPRAEDLLVRYENASPRVEVQYIDPDAQPDLAQAMNVRTYGSIFVEYAGNREEAQALEEEDLTNAIIQVVKGQTKTACFLTGHGEADTENTGRDGFSTALQEVEGANYKTRVVSLVESPEVPADCTVVVAAGPQAEYFEKELEVLSDYVKRGGRLLVMLDHEKSPRWVDLLAEWGIQVNNDVVLDLSGVGQFFGMGPLSPLVSGYASHPITEVMGNMASFFPMVRTVERGDPPGNWTVTELFKTTANSFATEDLQVEEGEVIRNPDKERDGPLNLAVAATYDVPEEEREEAAGSSEEAESEASEGEEEGDEEETSGAADLGGEPEGRVVVAGTSLFARNNFLGRGGNTDLFLNMFNWLSSDEDLISIRPKDPEETPLNLTSADMSRLFWVTVVLFPAVIVITGVRVWWTRR